MALSNDIFKINHEENRVFNKIICDSLFKLVNKEEKYSVGFYFLYQFNGPSKININ
jgi:hypothetical protein